MPYGTIRTGNLDTDRGYTGQIADASTGLMYYGARYYDPSIGRFTTPDTIIPNPANPQALNRYAYALNNPVFYLDPTGHSVWSWLSDHADEVIVGVTVVVGVALYAACPFSWGVGCAAATAVSTLGGGVAAEVAAASDERAAVSMEVAEATSETVVRTSEGAAGTSTELLGQAFTEGLSATPDATNAISDEALVVRGGQNLPENIFGGSGVTVDADGVVHGVSVQAGTDPLETLVQGHIPHGQIGVTSVGDVGSIGGTVVPDPLPGNPFHCLLGGCTADELSLLLRPTQKNPFR